MKKVSLVGLLSMSLLIFGACGNSTNKENQSTDKNKATSEIVSTIEENNLVEESKSIDNDFFPASYEDGVLSVLEGQIDLIDHGYFESEYGIPVVVVRFNYTNSTDENQMIRSIIWDYFDAKQVRDDLSEGVGFYTFNEDEPYADEVSKSEAEIHPGATVQAAYGFSLNDTKNPLTIDFIDKDRNILGTREFPLK